ncbi:MAG: terminase large subunit [Rhodobacteraceae bacterium]|nr:terminase large subunit [Paracoccaceae bacterium]
MPFDVSFACLDWQLKLEQRETPIPELPINEKLAGDAVRCFNQLRLPDVIGKPKFADVGGDWFRDIIEVLFGCVDPASIQVDPETGDIDHAKMTRLVGELFLLVPKKNSKTTNSAALGLVALLLNQVPNASMLIAGPTQKVAETCFNQAMGMIEADPKLKLMLHIQEHRSRIKNVLTGAVLEIKTFDMSVLTGAIPIFAIIDELHLMSSKSYAKKVIGQIRGGMNKKNCLLVFITTQSAEEPSGVFKTELNYARAVRDGRVDPEDMLAVLYEFSEEMQTDKQKPWMDPRFWYMVTPNLDKSVNQLWLEREFRKAQDRGEDDVQLWLSQHLNIQIGLGLHSDRWVGTDYWLDQARPELTLEKILETSEVCVVGIDGGGLDDLLGLAVLGRHAKTKEWQLWIRAWAHDEVYEQRKNIAEKLDDFKAAGDLVVCHDATSDIEDVADICERLLEAGLIPEKNAIGLDPEGVADIVDELGLRGLTMDQMKAVSQGYKLNSAIKGMPRKLKKGALVHCGQDLMAWCVGNAKSEKRGNAEVVTKQASGSGKIDPLMAAFNAFMLMSMNPEAIGPGLNEFLSDPVMVI